jgi:hypothetical protein
MLLKDGGKYTGCSTFKGQWVLYRMFRLFCAKLQEVILWRYLSKYFPDCQQLHRYKNFNARTWL